MKGTYCISRSGHNASCFRDPVGASLLWLQFSDCQTVVKASYAAVILQLVHTTHVLVDQLFSWVFLGIGVPQHPSSKSWVIYSTIISIILGFISKYVHFSRCFFEISVKLKPPIFWGPRSDLRTGPLPVSSWCCRGRRIQRNTAPGGPKARPGWSRAINLFRSQRLVRKFPFQEERRYLHHIFGILLYYSTRG